MDWIPLLEPYYGKNIRLWIEDVSGEQKTAPSEHRLHKVELAGEQEIKFFVSPTQFLSIPIFEGDRTRLTLSGEEPHFVSQDDASQLIYWVYFAMKS